MMDIEYLDSHLFLDDAGKEGPHTAICRKGLSKATLETR